MTHAFDTAQQHRKGHPSGSQLSLLEIVVLAPLAAILALWVIPNAFRIEWSCVGSTGVQATSGDTFADVLVVAGTAGWLGVFVAVLFAQIAQRERVAALLPLVWFVVLIGGAFIAAASIGPAACPR